MPGESTLLAHLTPMFTDRVEDTAVEALGYILSKSPSSRNALNRVLQSGAAGLNSIERVRTQVTGESGARPDLVGYDEQDAERVLIEAKFWAGLTENQPNGYLERLPNDGPSVLLFVAPEARRDTLWAELRRRVGPDLSDISEGDGLRSAKVDGSERYLMQTSWRSLLGQMENETAEGSPERNDIRQLQGLTEHMDEEAFLPLRQYELAPEFPRRMLGLNQLVDDATTRARTAGLVSTESLAVSSRRTGYGRYISLFGATVWFGVDFDLWAREDNTPLWLDFRGCTSGTVKPDEVRRNLELSNDNAYVPIHLPVGVEEGAVLEAVVEELKQIGQTINPDYKI